VSSILSYPLTRIESIVIPKPYVGLTSRTVHTNLSLNYFLSDGKWSWQYLTRYINKSETPYPVLADVGTRGTGF